MEYNDLELLRARILSASIDELDAVLDSMIKHYIELIPATELVCLFLPRNDMKERKRILKQSVDFLLKYPAENKKWPPSFPGGQNF